MWYGGRFLSACKLFLLRSRSGALAPHWRTPDPRGWTAGEPYDRLGIRFGLLNNSPPQLGQTWSIAVVHSSQKVHS